MRHSGHADQRKTGMTNRPQQLKEPCTFLSGGSQKRNFVRLDPSSFAATFTGKPGGNPTVEDEVAFHRAFPNDAVVNFSSDYTEIVPELAWRKEELRRESNGAVV